MLLRTLTSGLILFTLSSSLSAQQAIINLPSADITPEGKHFLMNESFIDPGVWNSVNFYTYGVTEGTEFAVTLYDLGKPARDSLAAAIGYKSQFDLAADNQVFRDLKVTHGLMLPVNLRGQGVGVSGYAHLSGRLQATDTRLTAGIAAGTSQLFGRPTVCAIVGIEQPLTSEVQLIAEWYSGNHEFANLITGVVYHNHEHDFVIVAGYKFPNNYNTTKNGIVIEFGGFF